MVEVIITVHDAYSFWETNCGKLPDIKDLSDDLCRCMPTTCVDYRACRQRCICSGEAKMAR